MKSYWAFGVVTWWGEGVKGLGKNPSVCDTTHTFAISKSLQYLALELQLLMQEVIGCGGVTWCKGMVSNPS